MHIKYQSGSQVFIDSGENARVEQKNIGASIEWYCVRWDTVLDTRNIHSSYIMKSMNANKMNLFDIACYVPILCGVVYGILWARLSSDCYE